MAIISILGIGAWNAVAVSMRLAGRIHDRVIESAHVLRFDDTVRRAVERVRVPFWASELTVETGSDGLSAAFMDGDPAKELTLSFKEGILSLGDGESVTRFTDFTDAEFSAAEDSDHLTYGILIHARTKTGKDLSITARFGGTPIAGRAGP
jgi:hypothetical protein